MPTDLLPLRVEHFLLRACPSAVLATHDIVGEAVRRNLRDEDVISRLVKEYNCDRLGFPIGPMPQDQHGHGAIADGYDRSGAGNRSAGGMLHVSTAGSGPEVAIARRRRMVINFYIVNKIFPIDLMKVDIICDDASISDGAVLEGLRLKYGRTEIGYPYPKLEQAPSESADVNTSSATKDANSNPDATHGETAVDPLLVHEVTSPSTFSSMAKASSTNQHAEQLALKHEVELMFLRAAPERMAEAKGIIDSFSKLGGLATKEDILASVRRSLGSCGSDGWPMDADKRRLARLQRFFLNNDPTRLFERTEDVTEIVNSQASEHAIFLELQYAYGKDELGRPVEKDQYLHDEVSLLLSRCRPLSATEDFICTYLALGERKGWDGERLLQFLRELFDCDREGWPLDIRQRIRSKTLRYLMLNAPEDVGSVDVILNEIVGGSSAGSPATLGGWHGEGLNESLIMTRLYERYGKNDVGKPILNTPATRFRVCEFLEQYVPESEVERLADAALGLNMFPDTLMNHLKQQYSTFTPYPNALRWQLKAIYQRAAPDKMYQVDQLMRVKRIERIPDASIIKAVCAKLNCGPDGWPTDAKKRRRKRLQLFFEQHDPPRLMQIDLLMTKDPRSEEQIMHDLEQQYRVTEGHNPSYAHGGSAASRSQAITIGVGANTMPIEFSALRSHAFPATDHHQQGLFDAEHSYAVNSSRVKEERTRRDQQAAPVADETIRTQGTARRFSEYNSPEDGMAMSPIKGVPSQYRDYHHSSVTESARGASPTNAPNTTHFKLDMSANGNVVHTITPPQQNSFADTGRRNELSREAETFGANRHKYRWLGEA